MIDQATIGRIIEAAEITDVISDFIHLRKRGVNFLGLCPFHNEKTPSFTVSPAKGIFKCFGCGKGGNSVNFIMEHENLTYPEALKWLAKKYNIEVVEKEETEEEKAQKDERESMMIVSSYAQKYYTKFLWEENEGRSIGLSYFRERGLKDQIIQKFELGYCPDGKKVFTDDALKNGYKMEFLEKTGLSIKRDEWVVDRFSGRVMFPIHNLAGRVIAFGGRFLKEDKNAAKYLNSPESEIYHKSKVLYGIFQAKRELIKTDRCYLVEGYTDVLAMHQAGIENVVASSGTALTPDQVRLIKRFTPNITILYDGDEAGIKASLRGIDLVLEEGMNVKVLLLPDGEDPDSFSRSRSSSEFLDYIKNNEADFIQFKTRLLMKGTENDPVAKARLISEVIRSVSVIPDTITRSVYIKECSKILGVDEEVLYAEVQKNIRNKNHNYRREGIVPPQTKAPSQPKVVPQKEEGLANEEKEVLRFLLKYGNEPLFELEDEEEGETEIILVGTYIISEIEDDDLVADNSIFQKFFHEFQKQNTVPGFNSSSYFVNHQDIELSRAASDLLSEKYIESKRWHKAGAYTEKEEDILDMLVPKIVNEYKIKKVREMLHELEEQIVKASSENNMEQVFECQSTYMNLKKVEKALSDQLGNRTFI